MDSIVINTERLTLKPLGLKYLKSAILYSMDYENTKYMRDLPDRTVEETRQFLMKAEKEWEKENPRFLEFAVIYRNMHIGAVNVYSEKDGAELGWIIQKNYWGKGFAYEAAKALVEYTKAEKALVKYTKTEGKGNCFFAHCDSENIASYKVMEKLGMKRTGEWGGRKNKSSCEERFEYRYELHF